MSVSHMLPNPSDLISRETGTVYCLFLPCSSSPFSFMLSSLSTHTFSLLVSRFLSSSSIRPAREGSWTLQLQLYHSQRLGRCGSRVGLRGRVGISSSSASNPQISRNSYLSTPPSPPLSNSFRPHPPTPQSLIRPPLPPKKPCRTNKRAVGFDDRI